MGKELKVHSDAAYDAAHRLAEETGESVDAVVEQALRSLESRRAPAAPHDARSDEEAVPGPLDPAARRPPQDEEGPSADAIIEAAKRDIAARRRAMTVEGEDVFSEAAIARRRAQLEAIVAENRRHLRELPTFDDSDFYDEYGLPK